MPPKPPVVAKKGQTNLFSFFNKPKNPEEVPVAAGCVSEGDSTPCHASIKKSNDNDIHPGSAATSKANDSPFSTMSSQTSQVSQDDNYDRNMDVDDAPIINKSRSSDVRKNEGSARISIVERGTQNNHHN